MLAKHDAAVGGPASAVDASEPADDAGGVLDELGGADDVLALGPAGDARSLVAPVDELPHAIAMVANKNAAVPEAK
ncbi:MAG: hypothetical protein ACRELY_25220 [Polyangiaceae bacterium]